MKSKLWIVGSICIIILITALTYRTPKEPGVDYDCETLKQIFDEWKYDIANYKVEGKDSFYWYNLYMDKCLVPKANGTMK